jgi:2-phospho-L-lactate guanylyltransferase
MSWTAIVPLNYGRDCKTRLASLLSPAERSALVEAMARHVLEELSAIPAIGQVALLSPERPPFAGDSWIADGGRGLNAELADARARFPGSATLFIHADLPLLAAADVMALLAAAGEKGAAIAPDLAGTGTNALAIADDRAAFTPAFGPGSFAAHRAALPGAAIVTTEGLGLDVDEPESLHEIIARRLPWLPPLGSDPD